MIVDVVIPALNEEKSIALVLGDIPKNLVRTIVVVDNGSTDKTAYEASQNGAVALSEPNRGYGAACLKGISYCASLNTPPDVIAFMDADYSDYPQELSLLLEAIKNGADLVIGSRALGNSEKGSLTFPQRFGNALAAMLLRLFYGVHFTDLGPFRAIRFESLQALNMVDRNYGWTVEMQLKAARLNLVCAEVPVSYRNRVGVSKISGSVSGSVKAGYKILYTIFKHL